MYIVCRENRQTTLRQTAECYTVSSFRSRSPPPPTGVRWERVVSLCLWKTGRLMRIATAERPLASKRRAVRTHSRRWRFVIDRMADDDYYDRQTGNKIFAAARPFNLCRFINMIQCFFLQFLFSIPGST